MSQTFNAVAIPLASGSGGGGSGTVTSVALALPNIFTVSGSPVTTSGTLTAVLASQSQNLLFASPNGASGVPSFRAMVDADIPTALAGHTITGGSIDNTPIGGSTPSTVAATALTVPALASSNTALTITKSDTTSGAWLVKGIFHTAGLGTYSWLIDESQVFQSVRTPISHFGYNIGADGLQANGSEPTYRHSITANYVPGAGQHATLVELTNYINTSGVQNQIDSVTIDRVNDQITRAVEFTTFNWENTSGAVWRQDQPGLMNFLTDTSVLFINNAGGIKGYTTGSALKGLITINSADHVSIDKDGIGTVFGAGITATTLTLTGTITANFVYAGPTSGAAAAPAFRALVAADIPSLDASKITTGQLALARGGTNADLSATGGANQFLKQTSSGAAITVAGITAGDLTTPLASPPAIGGTVAAAGSFTTLSASSTMTITGADIQLDNSRYIEWKDNTAVYKQVITLNSNNDFIFQNANSYQFVKGQLTINQTTAATNAVVELDTATPNGAQLVVQGSSDGNINIRGNSATRLMVMTQNGHTLFGKGSNLDLAQLAAVTDADGTIGSVIRGHSATQSGDLQEWQKSDTTVLAKIDASGNATFASLNLTVNVVPLSASRVYANQTFI